jgi:hypothetical protein
MEPMPLNILFDFLAVIFIAKLVTKIDCNQVVQGFANLKLVRIYHLIGLSLGLHSELVLGLLGCCKELGLVFKENFDLIFVDL